MVKLATGTLPTEHLMLRRCPRSAQGVFDEISHVSLHLYQASLGWTLSPVRHGRRCLRQFIPPTRLRRQFNQTPIAKKRNRWPPIFG
jgi:hypothetical protein